MYSKKELEFDFRNYKAKKENLFDENKLYLDTTILDTVMHQFMVVMIYSIFLTVLKYNSMDLTALIFFMTKISLTVNAITQAVKYFKSKNIKHQLVNGLLNAGILWYIFKGNGFAVISDFAANYMNIFFNLG